MENSSAALFWSGGKDSAFALWSLQNESQLDIKYLVTTINRNFNRVSMHGLREEIIERQVKETGYPLLKMYVEGGSNEDYEASLSGIIKKLKEEGINIIVFGDIFLDDLRDYRDNILNSFGVKGIYPLWKKNTTTLLTEMKRAGFRTVICCVNAAALDENFAGEELGAISSSMPKNIDPCGENGEFHTFCFEGPIFHKKIPFSLGEKIFKPIEMKKEDLVTVKAGYWFIDIV